MKINQKGINLIKKFEGCELESYQCPAGKWTIGYGHTGPDVKAGQAITEHQAEAILRYDLDRFEEDVEKLTKGRAITENQFSALVSFAFNVGSDIDADTKAEGLGDSTLLRLFLNGATQAAADEFRKWIYGGGKVQPGLIKRREAERQLFLEV